MSRCHRNAGRHQAHNRSCATLTLLRTEDAPRRERSGHKSSAKALRDILTRDTGDIPTSHQLSPTSPSTHAQARCPGYLEVPQRRVRLARSGDPPGSPASHPLSKAQRDGHQPSRSAGTELAASPASARGLVTGRPETECSQKKVLAQHKPPLTGSNMQSQVVSCYGKANSYRLSREEPWGPLGDARREKRDLGPEITPKSKVLPNFLSKKQL